MSDEMTDGDVKQVLSDLLHLVAKQIQLESLFYTNTIYGEHTLVQRLKGVRRLTKNQDRIVHLIAHYNNSTYELLIKMTQMKAFKQDLIESVTQTTNKPTVNELISLQSELVDYMLKIIIALIPYTVGNTHSRLKALATSTRTIQQEIQLGNKQTLLNRFNQKGAQM